MRESGEEYPAPAVSGMHPDDVALHAAQVAEMLRQVEGLLTTVSTVTQRLQFLASELRGLETIGQPTDPLVRLREEAAQGSDRTTSSTAGRGALAMAQAAGSRMLRELVSSGELVPPSALAKAWNVSAQSLVAAETRHELFSLRVGGKRFYIAELLQLEREAVAAICVSLYPMEATEKYIFWKRKHGSLRGQTVMERLGDGNWKDDLAAVLRLAIGISDQERLGTAMGGDPAPAKRVRPRTSPLLLIRPQKP